MISAKRMKELKEGAEPVDEIEAVFKAVYEASAAGMKMTTFFDLLEYPMSEFTPDELRLFIVAWADGDETYKENQDIDEFSFNYETKNKKTIH